MKNGWAAVIVTVCWGSSAAQVAHEVDCSKLPAQDYAMSNINGFGAEMRQLAGALARSWVYKKRLNILPPNKGGSPTKLRSDGRGKNPGWMYARTPKGFRNTSCPNGMGCYFRPPTCRRPTRPSNTDLSDGALIWYAIGALTQPLDWVQARVDEVAASVPLRPNCTYAGTQTATFFAPVLALTRLCVLLWL
jgi:hypothetical protein